MLARATALTPAVRHLGHGVTARPPWSLGLGMLSPHRPHANVPTELLRFTPSCGPSAGCTRRSRGKRCLWSPWRILRHGPAVCGKQRRGGGVRNPERTPPKPRPSVATRGPGKNHAHLISLNSFQWEGGMGSGGRRQAEDASRRAWKNFGLGIIPAFRGISICFAPCRRPRRRPRLPCSRRLYRPCRLGPVFSVAIPAIGLRRGDAGAPLGKTWT